MSRTVQSRWTLVAVVVTLGLASCGQDGAEPDAGKAATPGPETVAQVGDELIQARELAYRVNTYSPALRRKYKQAPELLQKQLEALIEEELIVAVARRRGLDRDPRIKRLIRQALVEMVREDVLEMVSLKSFSDAEVERYYKAHPDEFSTPLTLRARHILVDDQATAEKVLAQAKANGQSEQGFIRLVKRYSTDASTRKEGGDLGPFTRPAGRVPPQVFQAARGMTRPGEIAGPVKSAKGWHIIRLTERQEPKVRPLEEVKVQARIKAFHAKRKAHYQRFLRELNEATPVRRYPERMSKVAGYIEE